MPEVYIDADAYRALVAALANLQPGPFKDRETLVQFALGEIANVWPDSIQRLPDVA